MTVALSDLRTRVLARADMTGTGFVSTSELNVYVNDSYNELYEIIVSRFEDYFTTSISFTVVAGDDGYTVPTAIFKIRGLDKAIGGATNWVSLPKFVFAERNRFNGVLNNFNTTSTCYDWVGSRLKLIPASDASGSYQLWYIPINQILVADGDAIHGDLEKWSDYIVIDSAIKCMQKEESDPSILVMQKEQMKARIEAMASNRDAGSPERITDVSSFDSYPWGQRRWL